MRVIVGTGNIVPLPDDVRNGELLQLTFSSNCRSRSQNTTATTP